jgi:chromatin remodeling complex protein RSC6
MSSQTSSATGIMSASAPAKTAKKVAKKEAAPEPVAAPAPVAEKAAPKAKAAKAAAAPAAAAAPVVVASTPVEAAAQAAPAGPTTTLDEDIKAVTGNLNTLKETVAAMLSQVKKLEKRVHREIKDARKRKRRVATTEGGEVKPRQPSIFERPTKVTDELCKFLGKANGTQMSRSEVTKAVNNYVKEKGLKNKHDIKPDAPLKKLLALPEGENLTYFNLQKYLNRHYVKEAPAATA